MRLRLSTLIAVFVLSTGSASAWEIKTTNDGLPVRWPAGDILVDISMGAQIRDITRESADSQVIAAFGTWSVAMGLESNIQFAPPVDELLGTQKDFLNVVRWGTDVEDPFVDPDALGTTYLTYRTTTGEILDADIVVNAVDYKWGVLSDGCGQRYDLQNILAHEAGHFLGVAHAPDHEEATMYPSAPKCETSKRALSPDDKAAAQYLYNEVALASLTPQTPIELANCSTAGGSGLALSTLVLSLLLWAAKRRRKEFCPEREKISRRRAQRALNRSEPQVGHRMMLWGALVMAGLSVPRAASASTMKYLEPALLASKAELVVQAKVLRQEVRLVRGYPTTFSTLEVSRCREEHCPQYLVVAQLGGEVGDIGLHVSGIRPLVVKKEFVLFLRVRRGQLEPVARSQGVFHIAQESGQRVLVRDLSGVMFAAEEGHTRDAGTWSEEAFALRFGKDLLLQRPALHAPLK